MIRDDVYLKLCRQAHDLRQIPRRLPLGCPQFLSIKAHPGGRLIVRYEQKGERYALKGFVEIGRVVGGVDPEITEPLECWHQGAESEIEKLPFGFFRDERGSSSKKRRLSKPTLICPPRLCPAREGFNHSLTHLLKT